MNEDQPVRVGESAPDFSLPASTGGTVSLADFRGKQDVVLYFYPKDDTPGCTAEACSFRDLRALFNQHGAEILGVSADTVRSHKKFRDKFHLTFPLLADTDHAVADSYGTWVEKSMYGRTYWGNQRATFVIDPDGRIAHVLPKVSPKTHDEAVLAALGDLAAA